MPLNEIRFLIRRYRRADGGIAHVDPVLQVWDGSGIGPDVNNGEYGSWIDVSSVLGPIEVLTSLPA